MLRAVWIAFASAALMLAACAHKRPYSAGQGPTQASLLAHAKPQIDAVKVPSAKVVHNRALRGDMA
ncbi:MAG: hypothetical protein AAF721_21580, partial [Myxococcota bacterium]